MGPIRPAALLAAVTVISTVLAACGGNERSAEAYCKAFYETAAPIRETYIDANENLERDPLGGLTTLLGAPGDLVVIFDSMADHAPDEIRSDTEAARDALKEEQDSLGDALSDPLGALGSGLATGLTTSGSFSRIDSYLNEHCPPGSALAQRAINGAR